MIPFATYVDAAGASLRSSNSVSLQSRIDAANVDPPDGIQLPAIADDRILPGGADPIGPPYPVVELALPEFEITGFDLGQRGGDVTTSVALRVWLLDVSYDRLWRILYRFSDCVIECLVQPGAFGQGVTVGGVRGQFGFNPETQEKQAVLASSVIVFNLDDTAARP